jgi:hypothetical protein
LTGVNKFKLKLLVDSKAEFGGWMEEWMDGLMGIKSGLRDCFAKIQ